MNTDHVLDRIDAALARSSDAMRWRPAPTRTPEYPRCARPPATPPPALDCGFGEWMEWFCAESGIEIKDGWRAAWASIAGDVPCGDPTAAHAHIRDPLEPDCVECVIWDAP